MVFSVTKSTTSKMCDYEVCPICQIPFGECAEVFHACTNKHSFHPLCLSHWFQSKALADPHPTYTCPICRSQSPDWCTVYVTKTITDSVRVAVRADFTVSQLKKQMEWTVSIPPCTMQMAVRGPNAEVHLLSDAEQLMRDVRSYHVMLQSTDAEYTLLHNIPRCTSASARFVCPISRGLLLDPVVGADGHRYDRAAIQMWIARRGNTSPVTRGNSILPLAELYYDPAFTAEVMAIVPDAAEPPSLLPPDTVITLRTHLPRGTHGNGTITARLGDLVANVARRIHPNAQRIITADGYLIRLALNATLSQCRIKDGDLLYVSF